MAVCLCDCRLATKLLWVFQLWDLTAGKQMATFEGHRAAVTTLAFHPEECVLASGSADRCAKVWDLETLSQIVSVPHELRPIRKVAWAPVPDCELPCLVLLLLVVVPSQAFSHDPQLPLGWVPFSSLSLSLSSSLFDGVHGRRDEDVEHCGGAARAGGAGGWKLG